MFCTNCGANNPIEANYCRTCGNNYKNQTFTNSMQGSNQSSGYSDTLKEQELILEKELINTSQANFIMKHWRGDYSLGVSYWIMGSLLTVVLIGLTLFLASLKEIKQIEPRTSGFIILAFYTFIILITLWQMVGIWRSADKHVQRGGKASWANLAKIGLLLGFLRTVGDFSGQGIPLIKEGALLIAGIDNTPKYEIRILNNGTELELAGGMPFGTTETVKKFLDAAPTIQVIHLNSIGGRVDEAYKLYRIIKEKNLITYTSTECLSACSIAFLAGRERYIANNAKLGFHSTAIAGLDGEIVNESNNIVRSTLKDHGIPQTFIERALSTSSKEMWFPTKDELLNSNVISSVVDSNYFGLSGFKQWKDAHNIELSLMKNSAYAALAQYDQKNYIKLRDILIAGVQNGKTGTVIVREVHSVLANDLIQGYLIKAPDEPLVRYWHSQIAEYVFLAKNNPRDCANLAFPEFATTQTELHKLISKELQTEDINALAGLVKGAATDPQGAETNPDIQSDIEGVLLRVGEKYPWALSVMQNPANFKDEPESLCGAVIFLYSEILDLPTNQSGPLLRNLIKSL